MVESPVSICPQMVSLGQRSNSIPFGSGWSRDGTKIERKLLGGPPGIISLVLKRDPRGCKQEAGCPDAAVCHHDGDGDTCLWMRLILRTEDRKGLGPQ